MPPLELSGLKKADDVPARPELKNRRVEIDTDNKDLAIMEGEKILAAFPITPGSQQLPAPIGTWQIVENSNFAMVPLGQSNANAWQTERRFSP